VRFLAERWSIALVNSAPFNSRFFCVATHAPGPSFWGSAGPGALALSRAGAWPRHVRADVACPVCGAHLGRAFRGGPPPSGTRITVASACLHHEPGAHHPKEAYDPVRVSL
jgi:peptide methionine sulfoxide reductase MsrB